MDSKNVITPETRCSPYIILCAEIGCLIDNVLLLFGDDEVDISEDEEIEDCPFQRRHGAEGF